MSSSLILILSLVISLGLALLFLRRKSGFRELATANASLGSTGLMSSLTATYIGPGLSIGIIGQTYASGWIYPLLTAVGYVVQLLLISLFLGPLIRRRFPNATTMGDITNMAVPNPSPIFNRLLGAFSALIMTGVASVMVLISGNILSAFLPVTPFVGGIIATLLVTGYTVAGGIRASVYLSMFQMVFFGTASVALLVACISSASPSGNLPVFQPQLDITALGAVGLFLSFALGDLLQPPFVQRILAARSARSVSIAFGSCAVVLCVWLVMVAIIGLQARHIVPVGTLPDDVFLSTASTLFGAVGTIVFLAVAFSVVISGHDAILNSAAVVAINDVLRGTRDRIHEQSATSVRLATVAISVLSLALSQYLSSIMHGILFLASVWGPAVAVPIVGLLLFHQNNHRSAITSMVVGAAVSLSWAWLGTDIPGIIPAMLASIASFALTAILTKTAKNAATPATE